MNETKYQKKLIDKIEAMFPGCLVIKNDPIQHQGIPDLVIFYRDTWAMLEVKTSKIAHSQPNQAYYINRLDKMSFAAFVYPENEEEVLDGLQRAFGSQRSTRVSRG